MKKVFTIIFVAMTGILLSQTSNFGIKGGLNVSTLRSTDFSNTIDWDFRKSVHLGIFLELGLTEKFAIQPELLYSAQGANRNTDDSVTKLDYLILPIMAKYYVAQGFSVEAGPQLGLLLSAKESGDENLDLKENIKGTDIGLGMGVGYTFINNLVFGTRFVFGLSNLDETDGTFLGDGISTKNMTIQLSMGYRFN